MQQRPVAVAAAAAEKGCFPGGVHVVFTIAKKRNTKADEVKARKKREKKKKKVKKKKK